MFISPFAVLRDTLQRLKEEVEMELNNIDWNNEDIVKYKTKWLKGFTEDIKNRTLEQIKMLEGFMIYMPESLPVLKGEIKGVLQDMDVVVEGLETIIKETTLTYEKANASRAK